MTTDLSIQRDIDAAGLIASAAVVIGGETALVATASSLAEEPRSWTRGVAADSRLLRLGPEAVRVPFPLAPLNDDVPDVGTESTIESVWLLATGRRSPQLRRRLELEQQSVPLRRIQAVKTAGSEVLVGGKSLLRANSPWHATVVAECIAPAVSVVRLDSASSSRGRPSAWGEREAVWMLEFGRLIVVQSWGLLATIAAPGDVNPAPAPLAPLADDAIRSLAAFRRCEARARALVALCPSLLGRMDRARICVRTRLAASRSGRGALVALMAEAAKSADGQMRSWADVLAYLQPTTPVAGADSSFLSVSCRNAAGESLDGPTSALDGPYLLECFGATGSAAFEFASGADAAVAINALESTHDVLG